MVLVQVSARPAPPNDRAAQNHHAGARRSAQSLRVDVHGGLTTVSASRSFPAAAPPDTSSCARRGRWASADAAGPLHDPTRRAGLGCSSSKSKSARHAVTPGVSGVERAPAAGLHGTCMSTARCLATWLSYLDPAAVLGRFRALRNAMAPGWRQEQDTALTRGRVVESPKLGSGKSSPYGPDYDCSR